MLFNLSLLAAAGLIKTSVSTPVSYSAAAPIVVTTVPDYVRPYVVRAYSLDGPLVGNQVYRFPVTGASSGGAFTLISTAATASADLGVLPHQHQIHYENFFCLRGRFQLWTEKDGDSQARQFTPGDYGAVPQNTTHTFQLLDPINEMVGVIYPGGFEKLFYTLASSNYTSSFNAPFSITANASSGGSDASVITLLEALDVYAQLDFSPRRDLVNGTAPASDWHSGPNALATNATTPFYIAKGRGPQYINGASGYWQVVSPMITPVQSDGNFTQGTITLSQQFANVTVVPPVHNLTVHTALEVLEGMLTVLLEGEILQLITGDVAFVPAGTPFSYWSTVAYTSVLYIGGGSETLDQQLIKAGKAWDYPLFPSGTTLP